MIFVLHNNKDIIVSTYNFLMHNNTIVSTSIVKNQLRVSRDIL